MNKKTMLIRASLISIVVGSVFFFKQALAPNKSTSKQKMYKTQKLTQQTVTGVSAVGRLEPTGLLEIGPYELVAGVVQEIYVQENEKVTKGQTLAYIDDSRSDNFVRETEAAYKAAQAAYTYQKSFYERQKALYAKQFISQDFYEQVTRDLIVSREEVNRTKAVFDQAALEFYKKQILSPIDGTVIRVNATLGQTLTTLDRPSVIFLLAEDLTTLMMNVQVDQKNISKVRKNMRAVIKLDSFANDTYTGIVKDISNEPIQADGTTNFIVRVIVDNSLNMLRPGMTGSVILSVPTDNDGISVPQTAFNLDRGTLTKMARAQGYAVRELSDNQKKLMEANGNMRSIWTEQNNMLSESLVEVGDQGKIIAGLTGTEEIIVDTLS